MARRIHFHPTMDRGGRWSWTLFGIAFGMLPGLASADPAPSQTKQPAAKAPSAARAQRTAKKSSAAQDEAKEVADVVSAFKASDNTAFLPAYNALANKLRQAGPECDKLARQLLARRKTFVTDDDLTALRNAAGKAKPVVAAQLLLQVARARNTVRSYQRGHVVVGRLIVEDGKTDSELVLAQMPILPDGYFVGEVADLQRPICFRAQGYQALDVPLAGKKGDVVSVGEVRLKTLPEAEQATMRGTVELDGEGAPATAKAQIHLQVGPINTPHNGFSPRGRWPTPIVAPVNEKGEFVAEELTPGDYYIQIMADKHAEVTKRVSLTAGQQLDLGSSRLVSTDIAHYIGKPAPETKELAWEKDFAAAAARAKAENKPLMVMMTATWCGYCKMLENQTLNDPWVRYFLSPFVVVKAYEDKEVEGKYGQGGYPTLVFTDSEGKLAYKSIGFKPTVTFCTECAQAVDALKLTLPDELKTLIDKKVIAFRASTPNAALEQAPKTPGASVDRYVVPDGDMEKLLAFIKQLREFRPTNAADFMTHRTKGPAAIGAAAEKILALKPGESSIAHATARLAALEPRLATLPTLDAGGRKASLDELDEALKNKAKHGLEMADVLVALTAARALEYGGDPHWAAEAHRRLATRIGSDGPFAAQARGLEGTARRLDLVGNELKLEGKTVAGEAFDWASYRGKVVLIDFWATWCGPCVAEVPNVKSLYEQYHERGFDIVGVSLDRDRAALDKFLADRQIPWTTLHESNGQHAATAYYGINAIPTMLLVGRDGKVVSIQARGEELQRLLADLIGPAEENKTDE